MLLLLDIKVISSIFWDYSPPPRVIFGCISAAQMNITAAVRRLTGQKNMQKDFQKADDYYLLFNINRCLLTDLCILIY